MSVIPLLAPPFKDAAQRYRRQLLANGSAIPHRGCFAKGGAGSIAHTIFVNFGKTLSRLKCALAMTTD
jgi:hypothetical protein